MGRCDRFNGWAATKPIVRDRSEAAAEVLIRRMTAVGSI